MKLGYLLLFFLVSCWALQVGPAPNMAEPIRFQAGDDPLWRKPELDDRDWLARPPDWYKNGWWWARQRVMIPENRARAGAWVLEIQTLGSYEVFWDGVLIGRNGIPGSGREREVAGGHHALMIIPGEMASPGAHLLAMRISTFWSRIPSSYFHSRVAPIRQIVLSHQVRAGFFTAVFGLLESLADELDCFFKIGDRDLVPLTEELALCRGHVETMAFVKDCRLELHFEGPEAALRIPPGLLMTCVENALTHGRFGSEGGEVEIRLDPRPRGWSLEIRNPAEPPEEIREGTGTRYLRALLSQHYPESWSLTSAYRDGYWLTTITVAGLASNQGIA